MKLVVWKIGDWKPSKFEDGNNLVVVFKGIHDSNSGKTYRLNLNSLQPQKQDWLRALVEGNVLDVQVPQGSTNINKFGSFRVVHTAAGREAVDEDGNLPEQLGLPI